MYRKCKKCGRTYNAFPSILSRVSGGVACPHCGYKPGQATGKKRGKRKGKR